MKLLFSLALASCVLVLSAAALAGGRAATRATPTTQNVPFHEVACQNLPGADFKPGALKLPLTVHERSGVARQGALVSGGVPFPPGFLQDVSKLAVLDQAGKPVICQATVMTRWWKPAYDDSVQWALVSFLADVPAEGATTYFLTDEGNAAPVASPLTLAQTDKDITIDTGAAVFTLPKAGD